MVNIGMEFDKEVGHIRGNIAKILREKILFQSRIQIAFVKYIS